MHAYSAHPLLRSSMLLYALPLVPAAVYSAHRLHAAVFFIMGKYLHIAHRINRVAYVS